mmetsp:Transcript_47193/g.147501  ORF Transcript_47193/g.147501 Transcript_47193/m.147501 type:complete len:389 (-) Transcript_47193:381-1547(-)
MCATPRRAGPTGLGIRTALRSLYHLQCLPAGNFPHMPAGRHAERPEDLYVPASDLPPIAVEGSAVEGGCMLVQKGAEARPRAETHRADGREADAPRQLVHPHIGGNHHGGRRRRGCRQAAVDPRADVHVARREGRHPLSHRVEESYLAVVDVEAHLPQPVDTAHVALHLQHHDKVGVLSAGGDEEVRELVRPERGQAEGEPQRRRALSRPRGQRRPLCLQRGAERVVAAEHQRGAAERHAARHPGVEADLRAHVAADRDVARAVARVRGERIEEVALLLVEQQRRAVEAAHGGSFASLRLVFFHRCVVAAVSRVGAVRFRLRKAHLHANADEEGGNGQSLDNRGERAHLAGDAGRDARLLVPAAVRHQQIRHWQYKGHWRLRQGCFVS